MRVECSCGKMLKVADEMAGKKIRCPACKEIVPIPQAEEEEPRKAVKPAAAKSSPPAKSKPSKPVRARDDEDEEADEAPKKSKRSGAGKKSDKERMNPAVLWGSIAAGVVLLGGGIGLAFYLTRDKEKPAKPPSNPVAVRPPQNGMPPGGFPKGLPPGGQIPPGFQIPPGGQFPGVNVPPGGQAKEEPAIAISLDQLFKEYTDNANATKMKYHNKLLNLQGVFDELGRDDLGYLQVLLQMPPDKSGLAQVLCCNVSGPTQQQAKSLTKGQKVTIRGRFLLEGSRWFLDQAALVSSAPDPAIFVTSMQLTKEFTENVQAATKKYGGKILVVEGAVEEVKQKSGDGGSIFLESFRGNGAPPLRLEGSYAEFIKDKYAGVKKGDKIKFKGECLGVSSYKENTVTVLANAVVN